MRSHRLFRISVLLLLATVLHASELHPVSDPDHVGLGGARIAVCESHPNWQVRERRWASEHPLYLQLHLGDTGTAIPGVVDEAGGNGAGYDTFYIDSDGDGELVDEKALHPKREGTGRATSLRADSVRVEVPYADGRRRKLKLRIALSGFRDPKRDTTTWSAQCHTADLLAGTVDIGARKDVSVALLDRSFEEHPMNACFNDYGMDRLRIDLDGNGKLEPEAEEFPLSKTILVDGQLWELAVDAAAQRIVVRPNRLPTGHVRLTVATDGDKPVNGSVDLVSDAGHAFTYRLPHGGALDVPEDEYRISRGTLRMVDNAQRTWVAVFSRTNVFAVPRGRASALRLGLPFRAAPETESDLKLGDSACITAHLFGAAGEEYLNVAPRQMRMKPDVRIEDAVDIVVAEGSMEYG